jgi:Uncharacterized homolog of phage Mu protein gp47
MFDDEMDEEYWSDLAEEIGEGLGVDVREGSVFMDMQIGHCMRTAKFYGDLALMYEMMMPDSATGEFLTEYAALDNVYRIAATPSCWSAIFQGWTPEAGAGFMCGDVYLTLADVDGVLCLVANEPGEGSNHLVSGSDLIPEDNIDDLESATLGELIVPGMPEETDEDLLVRWRNSKVNPQANSNISQMKLLCEQAEGIGKAKIFPLWGGANTVKAVLLSKLGRNVSDEIVDAVQMYIDPVEKGYEVAIDGKIYIFGDGLGEGAANIGLHFLAVSAKPVYLTVTASVALKDGYTMEQVADDAKSRISAYLSRVALDTSDKDLAIVRISNIGSIFTSLSGVLDYDYDSLTINGSGENMAIDQESVAILSEVVLNASA